MLRALGFKKTHLVGFLMMQAMSFSIPGLIMGLVIATIFNFGFQFVIYAATKISFGYGLSSASIWIGIVAFGILVPILSNITPIKAALSKNLR